MDTLIIILTFLILIMIPLPTTAVRMGPDGGGSTTGDGSSPEDFLEEHNKARAEVGVEPLVWNETVAEYARQFAQKRSEDCALQHSEGPYGECIAEGLGRLTGIQAVGLWVGEKKDFDPVTKKCRGSWEVCGHYTQVVWRKSERVGCAQAKCQNNGWTFITCNYDPPGNYDGESPY